MTSSSLDKRIKIVLGSQFGDEGKGKLTDVFIHQFLKYTEEHNLIPVPKKDGKLIPIRFRNKEGQPVNNQLLATNPNRDDFFIFCGRFNGSSNAGHTIVKKDRSGKVQKYATHLLPSGIVSDRVMCIIGNGVHVNIKALIVEIDDIASKGVNDIADRLIISKNAHVTLRIHCDMDGSDNKSIGTTKQGVGPASIDKAKRIGIRMEDLVGENREAKIRSVYEHYRYRYTSEEDVKRFNDMLSEDLDLVNDNLALFKIMVCNTGEYLRKKLVDKRTHVLIEGANAGMLDPDAGTYPYVTTTPCTIGAVLIGLGLNMQHLSPNETEIIGVVKAYMTRVGAGTHPTQQDNKIGECMQTVGQEVGVTTGRKRRCGWICLKTIEYTHSLNGYDTFNLTKLDVLSSLDPDQEIQLCVGYKDKTTGEEVSEIPVNEAELANVDPIYESIPGWSGFDISKCKTWDDLHPNIKTFVETIEKFTGVRVAYINTGADRDAMIFRC